MSKFAGWCETCNKRSQRTCNSCALVEDGVELLMNAGVVITSKPSFRPSHYAEGAASKRVHRGCW
jgi:hypothetical protein